MTSPSPTALLFRFELVCIPQNFQFDLGWLQKEVFTVSGTSKMALLFLDNLFIVVNIHQLKILKEFKYDSQINELFTMLYIKWRSGL